jgi:membrane-associated phospholipid phosphatase
MLKAQLASRGLRRSGEGIRTASLWWGLIALLGLAVPVAFLVDEQAVRQFAAFAPAQTWQHRVFQLPKHLFRTGPIVLIVALLALDARRRQLLIGFAAAFLTCVALTHLVKFLVGRARPDLLLGPATFMPFGDPRLGFDSFPSGHTSTAVLLAALLSLYWPRTRWVLIPAAILASLGRIVQERHFPSDVLAGAALALLVVRCYLLWLSREHFQPTLSPLSWFRNGRHAEWLTRAQSH